MGRRPTPLLAEAGSTGLNQYRGYIHEEWHPKLQGQRAIDTYREMSDNCAVVGAMLYAIEMLVRQVDWRDDAADSSPEAALVAQKITQMRGDMESNWTEVISEILSMLTYGWSLLADSYKIRRGPGARELEMRSKYDDGWIGWRDLSLRSQDTLDHWEITPKGKTEGMWQRAAPRYRLEYIPRDRSMLFRLQSHKDNPQGRSLLRTAYRSWHFLKRVQELEAIGFERDAAGMVVIKVPVEIMHPNADVGQKAIRTAMEDAARNIKRNSLEGVVFPAATTRDGKSTGYDLQLLSSGGSRQFNSSEIIQRYEKRILTTALADVLLLGQDSHGSYSLVSSRTTTLAMSIKTILASVVAPFNRLGYPRILDLNGIPAELSPTLAHGDIESPDFGEFATAIATLAGAGLVVSDDELEDEIRRRGQLPVLERPQLQAELEPEPEI